MGRANYCFEYLQKALQEQNQNYEVCNVVLDAWQTNKDRKAIINLFCNSADDHASWRRKSDSIYFSNLNIVKMYYHFTHIMTVAQVLQILKWAYSLVLTVLKVHSFGNGERTGNADIITIAMNIFCFRR